MTSIVEKIREFSGKLAIDIVDATALLISTYEEVHVEMGKQIQMSFAKGSYRNVEKITAIAAELDEWIQILRNSISEGQSIIDEDSNKSQSATLERVKFIASEEVSTINKATSYTYTKPIELYIFNDHFSVSTWRELLICFGSFVQKRWPTEFSAFVENHGISTRKRKPFSRNPSDLRAPMPIDNYSTFVETHISANGIIALMLQMMEIFHISKKDLKIATVKRKPYRRGSVR